MRTENISHKPDFYNNETENDFIPEIIEGRLRMEMIQQQLSIMASQSKDQKNRPKKVTHFSKIKDKFKALWEKFNPHKSLEDSSSSSSDEETSISGDVVSYF